MVVNTGQTPRKDTGNMKQIKSGSTEGWWGYNELKMWHCKF